MANTFGYGAMTNSLGDIQNSKAIIIFGSNPAVNHPVGFQHFLKAKERNNAQIIVIDPRYTKTAAKADLYAPIRPGTDIAFMYGMLNLIFENGWEDQKYISDRVYGMDLIREEAKKWTPEVVEDVTGVSADLLKQITRVYAKTKPGTLIWCMGLTQHSIGTGNTRLAPILQMALGNIGVSGGGCNILRGHDNVQGSSDMGCFPDSLPGYYGIAEGIWKYYAKSWGVDYEWLASQHKSKEWMSKPGYSLARWWSGVQNVKDASAENNAGTNIKALFVMANGITSVSQQARVKEGLDKLDLLVVVDAFANEAVTLTDKQDNVFLLPAATQFETSGSVVATNRSIQWRYQVVEPLYESKPDQAILFELAKRLGFYDNYVKAMGDGKGNFKWPEDATNEIARIIQSVGYAGRTAERAKKHTDNWHMFDNVTMMGTGPLKGEFYGLPWPCWTQKHSGSPILYDISKPVSEGGMGFRNRFGLEHNGVSQLAAAGSAPKGSKVKDGYPQITKENIEKVLGITLTEDEKAKMGASWATDPSNIIAQKCLEAGVAPYGNARARCLVWEWEKLDHMIPTHREPLHTPRTDLVAKYPSFEKDRPNHFRTTTHFRSVQQSKDFAKEFPINLITGRIVNMNGAGVENRVSKYLAALTPEMFVDINPELANSLGIRNGDMVWIHSPEGTKIKVKAKFSFTVGPDRVFIPFHFAGHFQGEDLSAKYPEGTKPYAIGESACTVTNYGYDIITQIPETKGGLCRVEKA